VTEERWRLAVWCMVAAFGTYFCMYAFRKPFTAAEFAGYEWAGVGYKTLLVTAQVLGYTLSKFIGIKVIAEMNPARRATMILVLIAIAEAALLAFALVRPPLHLVCLFVNGLPLGMVFGLVLGFLEGRRLTEALSAGLCASFIVADGVVKAVGSQLLALGVSEFWMPVATGAVFAFPLVVFVWMLSGIPHAAGSATPVTDHYLLRLPRPRPVLVPRFLRRLEAAWISVVSGKGHPGTHVPHRHDR
jgi:hypothetical protein